MTDTNPFDTKDKTPVTPSTDNPFDTHLSKIVNDKGEPKYKDVTEALTALEHSQQHIKNLEAEAVTKESLFKETVLELEKRKSVEEVVQNLTQKQTPLPTGDPQKADSLSKDDMTNLIKEALTQRDSLFQETENQNMVMANLQEKFGEDTPKAIKKVLQDADLSSDDLQTLAKTNPKTVLKLFEGVVSQKVDKPLNPKPTNQPFQPKTDLAPPAKKYITEGVTTEDLLYEWRQIKQDVYNKLDVQT